MPSKKQQAGPIGRFFRSKAFVIILVFIVFFVAYGYGRAFYQDYKIRQEIDQLQREIKSLETKRLESLEILDYVMSDAFVEREARQALNLKESGEEVYVVTTMTTTTLPSSGETEIEGDLNNPTKWWYYFTQTQIHTNS